MWAHYTVGHTGFLIGFEAGPEILASPSAHRNMAPVVYCHHKPAKDAYEDLTNQELFYWKSSEWAYEREWRIVDSVFSADGDPVQAGRWPFQIRPEAVKEVVKGCRCSPVDELKSVLREPRYQHVKLVTASLDREAFKLNFSDQPRADWDAV
jgi:hypothetical protein